MISSTDTNFAFFDVGQAAPSIFLMITRSALRTSTLVTITTCWVCVWDLTATWTLIKKSLSCLMYFHLSQACQSLECFSSSRKMAICSWPFVKKHFLHRRAPLNHFPGECNILFPAAKLFMLCLTLFRDQTIFERMTAQRANSCPALAWNRDIHGRFCQLIYQTELIIWSLQSSWPIFNLRSTYLSLGFVFSYPRITLCRCVPRVVTSYSHIHRLSRLDISE